MDILFGFLPFIAMFAVMYFLLIRPQKKQQEQVKNMLDSLAEGDSVVTIGGLHGIVDEVNATNNTVVLDCEGIYLTFERRAIARIVKKGTETVTTNAEDLGTNEPESIEENLDA